MPKTMKRMVHTSHQAELKRAGSGRAAVQR
jgi:hypothetical protein